MCTTTHFTVALNDSILMLDLTITLRLSHLYIRQCHQTQDHQNRHIHLSTSINHYTFQYSSTKAVTKGSKHHLLVVKVTSYSSIIVVCITRKTTTIKTNNSHSVWFDRYHTGKTSLPLYICSNQNQQFPNFCDSRGKGKQHTQVNHSRVIQVGEDDNTMEEVFRQRQDDNTMEEVFRQRQTHEKSQQRHLQLRERHSLETCHGD